MPRWVSYHSQSCFGFSDLKNLPPMPVTGFMCLLDVPSRVRKGSRERGELSSYFRVILHDGAKNHSFGWGKELILRRVQNGDQHAAANAVEHYVAHYMRVRIRGGFHGYGHATS